MPGALNLRVFAHLAGGTQKLDVTAHDLRRIAENLIDRERRVPDLVHVANPSGLQMAFSRYNSVSGATVGFILTPGPPAEKHWIVGKSGQKSFTPITIYLGPRSLTEVAAGYSPKDPVLQTARVGDRTIIRKKRNLTVWNSAIVRYADGQSAAVLVPKSMSADELMRFAAGITPGADFTPVHR